jgi:hypothetical protein
MVLTTASLSQRVYLFLPHCKHTQEIFWDRVSLTFCSICPWTMILSISTWDQLILLISHWLSIQKWATTTSPMGSLLNGSPYFSCNLFSSFYNFIINSTKFYVVYFSIPMLRCREKSFKAVVLRSIQMLSRVHLPWRKKKTHDHD